MLQFIVLKELYFFILLWTLNTIPLFSVYMCKRAVLYYYVLLCVTAASSAVCNTPLKRNIAKLSTLWARLRRPSGRRAATATGTASLFQCVVLWDLCAWMCSQTSLIPQGTHETGYQKLTLMGGIFLMRDTYIIYIHNHI